MTHLEELLKEYYEWLGHVVKCNVLVGKRALGGYEMELDIVAYDPKKNRILHVEPSLDASSWSKREPRFAKKFKAGRKYILSDLFQWLPRTTEIIQRAILISCPEHRRKLADADVLSVDEMIGEIKREISCRGIASRAAVSERYPLLRTMQFTICGYYGLVDNTANEKRRAAIEA